MISFMKNMFSALTLDSILFCIYVGSDRDYAQGGNGCYFGTSG